MSLLTLASRNLRRNASRNVMTILALAMAVGTFALLRTASEGWNAGVEFAAQDRIATRHKVSFVVPIPKRYVDAAADVDGVESVTWMTWFGGKLPAREREFFANIATDPRSFLEVYDEVSIPDAERDAWIHDRQGAIAGAALARRFGWKQGEMITLSGTIYPGDWEFRLDGIYQARRRSFDESALYFHYDYLNESVQGPLRDQVGWLVSRVDDPGRSTAIAAEMDRRFEASEAPTLTMSERALNLSFVGAFSALMKSISLVSMVILLISVLIVGNTVALSVSDRTREYGMLRAVGFGPGHLGVFVLCEGLLVGLAGGLAGVTLAAPFINGVVGPFVEENFTAWFPLFRMQLSDGLAAMGLACVVGAGAALLPAINTSRLGVVDALRYVG